MTAAIWAQSRLIISYTVVYRPFYGSWDDEFISAVQPSHRVAGWIWSSSCYTGGSDSRCELWQLCALPTKFHTFAASHATNHLDYDNIHHWIHSMGSFPFPLWKHGTPNAAHRRAQRQRGGVQPVPSFHAQRQHGTAPATEAGGRTGQGGQCFCSTTGRGVT